MVAETELEVRDKILLSLIMAIIRVSTHDQKSRPVHRVTDRFADILAHLKSRSGLAVAISDFSNTLINFDVELCLYLNYLFTDCNISSTSELLELTPHIAYRSVFLCSPNPIN